MRIGKVRLHGNQLIEAGQGLILPLQRRKHDAELVTSRSRLRIGQQGAPESALRRRIIAALMFANAEQMQRIEMVRELFQDLFVPGLSFGKITCPVECQCPGELARDVAILAGCWRRAESPLPS